MVIFVYNFFILIFRAWTTDALTYKPRKRKADMELESEAVVGQGELELQK